MYLTHKIQKLMVYLILISFPSCKQQRIVYTCYLLLDTHLTPGLYFCVQSLKDIYFTNQLFISLLPYLHIIMLSLLGRYMLKLRHSPSPLTGNFTPNPIYKLSDSHLLGQNSQILKSLYPFIYTFSCSPYTCEFFKRICSLKLFYIVDRIY